MGGTLHALTQAHTHAVRVLLLQHRKSFHGQGGKKNTRDGSGARRARAMYTHFPLGQRIIYHRTYDTHKSIAHEDTPATKGARVSTEHYPPGAHTFWFALCVGVTLLQAGSRADRTSHVKGSKFVIRKRTTKPKTMIIHGPMSTFILKSRK